MAAATAIHDNLLRASQRVLSLVCIVFMCFLRFLFVVFCCYHLALHVLLHQFECFRRSPWASPTLPRNEDRRREFDTELGETILGGRYVCGHDEFSFQLPA